MIREILRTTVAPVIGRLVPALHFNSLAYLRHSARRLEHLASLRIPVAGKTVLEVGAGIGDHSHYYLDRGCRITITDARESNLKTVRRRFPDADVRALDLEAPPVEFPGGPWDIIHCYGLLYHVRDPESALRIMGRHCREMLLLETCVSFGDEQRINPIDECKGSPTQAFSGGGCRPTRSWVWHRLHEHFSHVYLPMTQPNHAEFPLDWRAPEQHRAALSRAVFVATREPLVHPLLTSEIPHLQTRHE